MKSIHPFIFRLTLIIVATLPGTVSAAGVEIDKLPKINQIAQHPGADFRYFAATDRGLFASEEGHIWILSLDSQMPATMVSETGNGDLYAFVLGSGLMQFDAETSRWRVVNNQLGAQAIMDLSGDASSAERLIALNQFGKLIVSPDAGVNWHPIDGPYEAETASERRGQSLYGQYCQSCHGVNGVGETYTLQSLTDQKYLRAPALNYSEHAWHHTDEQLIKTIIEGSPRTEKMPAFGDAGITEKNARDLVAYIKSLWTERELSCQGPKHMQCMQ